jgi:hypothetical protein
MLRFSTGVLGKFCLLSLLFSLVANFTWAQSETATVSGQVVDPSGLNITGAQVKLVDIDRDTSAGATTNNSGLYTFPSVRPGRYRIAVTAAGFKVVNVTGVTVNLQDHLEQNFKLVIGSVSESITVEGGVPLVDTESATVSTVVDRNFVENMPLNGRSFQDLILLTPGTITNTPQVGAQGFGGPGEFSVNGQRTESNYYTVDGVSGNVGTAVGSPGVQNSGSLASATALGTTQSLVSVDALEEFRVQSSTYSAEFGRNPGGQFSFVTRSGTNEWHGTGFDYLRNNAFDANNWFNDYFGQPETPLRQNDFGGTLGGPIEIPSTYHGKNRTFFFLSYEGLRVLQPQAATVNEVPTVALRQAVPTPLDSALNAFPVPNCPSAATNCTNDHGNGLGDFIGAWSNPARIDSTSVRLDHSLNDRLRLFFRFSDTSSNATMRGIGRALTPSLINPSDFTMRTYTFGATGFLTKHINNEFRINYSSNAAVLSQAIDDFGGAEPVDLAQMQGINTRAGHAYQVQFFLNFPPYPGLTQFSQSTVQRQWNLVDSVSASVGHHQFKFGIDYRRLSPAVAQFAPYAAYDFFSESSLQANSVDLGFGDNLTDARPIYLNFSAFAQDTWHVSSRLNLSLGLRWEVDPAPGAVKGNLPYTVEGVNNLSTMTLAPQGTPLWPTTWYNFAPRLGAAYALRNQNGFETVFRAGGGVFFDTGQQSGSLGYQGPGFSAVSAFGDLLGAPASFPVPLSQVAPPIINPPVPPYSSVLGPLPVYAFAPHYQLPYTLQWNASIGQALGSLQELTISYVGAHGDRLLMQTEIAAGSFNSNFGAVYIQTNGLTSDYNALQTQLQRRLRHGLQILASYTWSHSIDYGSFDLATPYLRGNSDFDVRHNFSTAFAYELPNNRFPNPLANALLDHWGVDGRVGARTGFPITLLGNSIVDPSTGSTYFGNLDLVPGQPLYIYGAHCTTVYGNGLGCPGGRAINPGAFTLPASGPGDAPRNFVRGFGAWQIDFAFRREFPLSEKLKLQFRAETFNVLNHPSFGTIDNAFGDPRFGQATATLNSSLQGLSPLYQLGGPRSMQFAMKLIF